MGNICGCVRVEKEEQYLDFAKIFFSFEKYFFGRKYFRRKSIKKIVDDTDLVELNSENEGKKRSIRFFKGQLVFLFKGLVREEFVILNFILEGGSQ